MLQLALVENVQRADLNPIEEAQAYRELIDGFGLTHEQVARQVGKSRVADLERAAAAGPGARDAARHHRWPHQRGPWPALAALSVAEFQRAVLQVVLDRHLSVRQTEELVRRRRDRAMHAPPASRWAATSPTSRRSCAGCWPPKSASCARGAAAGLVIDFYSDEELDRIYSIITRGASGAAASVANDDEVPERA